MCGQYASVLPAEALARTFAASPPTTTFAPVPAGSIRSAGARCRAGSAIRSKIATGVNNSRHDGPGLLAPVAATDQGTE